MKYLLFCSYHWFKGNWNEQFATFKTCLQKKNCVRFYMKKGVKNVSIKLQCFLKIRAPNPYKKSGSKNWFTVGGGGGGQQS